MSVDGTLSVDCPTCSGRIRVKDRSLLGQIVHCPRCQGLVLIQDDQEQVRVAVDEPADSQVETREAMEGAAMAAPRPEDSSQGAPPIAWQPPQASRARQIFLVGLVAICSLTIVSTLFYAFVRAMSRDPVAMAQGAKPEQPPPVAGAEEANQAGEAPKANDLASNDSVMPDEGASTDQASVPLAESPNANVNPSDAVPVPPTPDAASRQPESADPMPSAPAAPVQALPEMPPPVTPPPAAGDSASGTVPMLDLPPELRQYIPILANEAPEVNPEQAAPAPPTAEELRLQLNLPPPPDDRLHPPPAELLPVGGRLDRELTGLRANGDSLVSLCGLIEQLTGVPIWFDLATLDLGEVDLEKPLQVAVSKKTIGVTLRQVVESAGCEVVEDPPGMLCVRVPIGSLPPKLAPALAIDDFPRDDPVVAELIARLTTGMLVDGEGGSRLSVDKTQQRVIAAEGATTVEQWWGALALESLRTARGLPLRLPTRATSRWLCRGAPPEPQLPADAPYVGEGDFAVSLGEWLQRMARSQKSVAVVDWPSAWQHGAVAQKGLLPWIRGASQQQVLDELLGPLDLRVYQDGPGMWWIGTEDAYRGRVAFMVLPLSEGLRGNPDRVVLALAKSLAMEPQAVPAVIDPQSRCLITRLTHGVATQVAAELQPAAP